MQPKLSAIIPVYNMEKYIRQCLDSVYQQTFRDFEVIIIDDGSPDNCGDICDEYAQRYNSTIPTTVIHKENAGLPRAWNDGLSVARGEWVTFVDSDDWLEKDYYESMFNALGNQTADVFCAGAYYKNEGEKQTQVYCFDSDKVYKTREERNYMMTRILTCEKKENRDGGVILGATQAPWDKFYRNEFIKRHNLCFNVALAAVEDVLFNFMAFDQADYIVVSTVCGYHYRQVEQSYTRQFNPKRKDSFVTFLDSAIDYLATHENNPIVKKALNSYALGLMTSAIAGYFCHSSNPLPKREIAKEFMIYKKKHCFAEAIRDGHNPYISFKMKIWMLAFRIPGLAPAKLLYKAGKLKRDICKILVSETKKHSKTRRIQTFG